MKKKSVFLVFIFAAAAAKAEAVCPVCTVAVGAGVGFSRWLGIDDSITGLWLGAFLLSLSLWTIDWLGRKKINFFFKKTLVIAGYYALALVPLYFAKITSHPFDFVRAGAEDKLLIGIIQGTAAFFFAAKLYEFLKEKNNGHAHFPFEKIFLPVVILAFFSLIFYFLGASHK